MSDNQKCHLFILFSVKLCFNGNVLQVFQPMLMEYFTYEELKDIKKKVIAQHHSQQHGDCAAGVLKGFRLWSQAEELQKAFKYSDHEKTDYGECLSK